MHEPNTDDNAGGMEGTCRYLDGQDDQTDDNDVDEQQQQQQQQLTTFDTPIRLWKALREMALSARLAFE